MKNLLKITVIVFTLSSAIVFAQSEKPFIPGMVSAKLSINKIERKTAIPSKKTNPVYEQKQGRICCLTDNEGILKRNTLVQSKSIEIKTFPNPFVSDFFVNLNDPEFSKSVYEARIYDLQGKIVFSQTLSALQNTINLTGTGLGIYMLHIQKNGSEILQEKIIKQ